MGLRPPRLSSDRGARDRGISTALADSAADLLLRGRCQLSFLLWSERLGTYSPNGHHVEMSTELSPPVRDGVTSSVDHIIQRLELWGHRAFGANTSR